MEKVKMNAYQQSHVFYTHPGYAHFYYSGVKKSTTFSTRIFNGLI